MVGRVATRPAHQTVPVDRPVPAAQLGRAIGINAMVVDSTALPEQAVRDILAGAFRSAGQRCSALRILCL